MWSRCSPILRSTAQSNWLRRSRQSIWDARPVDASVVLRVGALVLRRCPLVDHSRCAELLRVRQFISRCACSLDRVRASTRHPLGLGLDEGSPTSLVARACRPHIVGGAAVGSDRLGFTTNVRRAPVSWKFLAGPGGLRVRDGCSGVAP